MITEQTLALAIERRVLTAEQAAQLRMLAASASDGRDPDPDDEQLRFVSGFADVFVTIGIALFLGGLVFLLKGFTPFIEVVSVAAASWALAEFFTRRRRMALPSIVLLLTFTGSICLATLLYAGGDFGALGEYAQSMFFGDNAHLPALLAASLATVLAALLHFRRFAVPITVAAGGAALTATAISLIGYAAPGLLYQIQRPLTFLFGAGFFGLAMWFDRQDLTRQTRKSDIAFWLHMLAAPLIVHSIAGYFARSLMLTTAAALLILAIFVVLGAVAILIDRRALLVSGLAYLGIAFSSLIRESALGDAILPMTIFGLGAFMLAISAAWQPLRRAVLRGLPLRFAALVPPARQNSRG